MTSPENNTRRSCHYSRVTLTGGLPDEQLDQNDITVVYEPKDQSRILADIVFVHGLSGHPEKTWLFGVRPKSTVAPKKGKSRFRRFSSRAKKSKDSRVVPCYWPSLLGRQLGNVRVLAYGYPSNPASFLGLQDAPNQSNISSLALNLMEDVLLTRGNCQGRVLIFVSHGLGGILVKGAINESAKLDDSRADLAASCRAILFFGTPHHGTKFAEVASAFSNFARLSMTTSVNKRVLDGLSRGSETLAGISRTFNTHLTKQPPTVCQYGVCTILEGTGLKSWGITSKVVEDTSARLNMPNIEREYVLQTKNHFTMCKFESTATQDYRRIFGYIECFVDRVQKAEEDKVQKRAAEAERSARQIAPDHNAID